MVKVVVTDDAAEQLVALPRVIRARMMKLLARLADWPEVSGAKPLGGELAGNYRLRTGDYRLQFRIEDGDVVVERLGHRDGFYEV